MRVRHMLGVFAIYLLDMFRYYKIVLIFAVLILNFWRVLVVMRKTLTDNLNQRYMILL